jgi:hypothetical protein
MAGPTTETGCRSVPMRALKFEHFGMLLFSEVPIPEAIEAELLDRFGGKILDGVTLDECPDIQPTPQDKDKVDAILCVSRSDSDHFEVIPYRDQAEALGFKPVELSYNVMRSEEGWEIFLSTMKSLTANAKAATGVEPPDSPGGA